jgi:hypothetical protein
MMAQRFTKSFKTETTKNGRWNKSIGVANIRSTKRRALLRPLFGCHNHFNDTIIKMGRVRSLRR